MHKFAEMLSKITVFGGKKVYSEKIKSYIHIALRLDWKSKKRCDCNVQI